MILNAAGSRVVIKERNWAKCLKLKQSYGSGTGLIESGSSILMTKK
jgi:hypothetical protein